MQHAESYGGLFDAPPDDDGNGGAGVEEQEQTVEDVEHPTAPEGEAADAVKEAPAATTDEGVVEAVSLPDEVTTATVDVVGGPEAAEDAEEATVAATDEVAVEADTAPDEVPQDAAEAIGDPAPAERPTLTRSMSSTLHLTQLAEGDAGGGGVNVEPPLLEGEEEDKAEEEDEAKAEESKGGDGHETANGVSPPSTRVVADERRARRQVGRMAAQSLPVLDWSRRRPPMGDEELGNLPAELERLGAHTVWLHDNSLSPGAGAPLGGAFSAASVPVCRVNLSGNSLGDNGLAALLNALTADASAALVSLGLGVNQLTAPSASLLAASLVRGAPLHRLRELRVGGNPIGGEGATALAQSLGRSQLRVLHLGHSAIGEAGGVALAEALLPSATQDDAKPTGSASIGIVDGAADATSAEESAEESPGTPPLHLRSLELQDCGLGAGAAAALGRALPLCALAELWVGGNPLTAAGAKAVAAGVAQSATLQRVWLDKTGLDDSACEELATVLTRSPTLAQLWLGSNPLSDMGVAVLAEALAGSASQPARPLRKLWLDHTEMTSAGARALVLAALGRGAPKGTVADARSEAGPTSPPPLPGEDTEGHAAGEAKPPGADGGAGAGADGGADGDAHGGASHISSGPLLQHLWIGGRTITRSDADELSAIVREAAGDGGGSTPQLRLVVDVHPSAAAPAV